MEFGKGNFERRPVPLLRQSHKFHEFYILLAVSLPAVGDRLIARPIHHGRECVLGLHGRKPLTKHDRVLCWKPVMPSIRQTIAKALADSEMDIMGTDSITKTGTTVRKIRSG